MSVSSPRVQPGFSACDDDSGLVPVVCGEAVGELLGCAVAVLALVLSCGGGVLTGLSKLHPRRIAAERTMASTKRCLSIEVDNFIF